MDLFLEPPREQRGGEQMQWSGVAALHGREAFGDADGVADLDRPVVALLDRIDVCQPLVRWRAVREQREPVRLDATRDRDYLPFDPVSRASHLGVASALTPEDALRLLEHEPRLDLDLAV